jgi:cytochrome c556
MFTIDGTFVDAKLALETGDTAAAKSDAIVLAELGQWLAADRAGDQWHTQSGDLVKAAQAAAENESNDSKALRAAFHNVYTRCEACHHRGR